jgi:hypothetical protein
MMDRRRFVAEAYRVRTPALGGSSWTLYLRVRRLFLEVNVGHDRKGAKP